MAPPALATATSAHRANATSPQRIGPVRAWVCAAHRTAQRTAPRSALHRANAKKKSGKQIPFLACRRQAIYNLGNKFHFYIRLRFSCGNIFGKQIGNVFVFTICFDVGLAVLC
jgi:hypothetical protein